MSIKEEEMKKIFEEGFESGVRYTAEFIPGTTDVWTFYAQDYPTNFKRSFQRFMLFEGTKLLEKEDTDDE